MLIVNYLLYLSLAPLYLRFKSVASPLQVRSIEWEENGTYTDFGTDLQGTKKIALSSNLESAIVFSYRSYQKLIQPLPPQLLVLLLQPLLLELQQLVPQQ